MDKLAGEAAISDNKVLLDPQAFVGMVTSHMSDVQDNKGPFKYIITPFLAFFTPPPPPCVILHLLLMNVMQAVGVKQNTE